MKEFIDYTKKVIAQDFRDSLIPFKLLIRFIRFLTSAIIRAIKSRWNRIKKDDQ